MNENVTPPVCCHCGRLMLFVAANPALLNGKGQWDESWRCPEGQWSLRRTVPPPPGYERSPEPAPPPERRRRPRTRRRR
jgi:hypothetical protein